MKKDADYKKKIEQLQELVFVGPVPTIIDYDEYKTNILKILGQQGKSVNSYVIYRC